MHDPSDITEMLITIGEADPNERAWAYDQLFPVVYDQLKKIAWKQLRHEYSDHTLSKTDLVHEVYIKLIDQTRIDYRDRTHFYGIAARCMRQILVDYARKKKAQKRGGDQARLPLDEQVIDLQKHADQIIGLDEMLEELAALDERLAKIVELRFFAGLSIEDTAQMLDISPSTANRDWAKARGWLYQKLSG